MHGPVPMDIGMAGEREYSECEEIDAVGRSVRCHKCEGWGHMARQCPSEGRAPKGGGKGTPPNGGGKGQPTGYEGNRDQQKGGSKGGGKGARTCYKCGKPGHIARDCWSGQAPRQTAEVEERCDEVQEPNEVGGVWLVAGVSKVEN